VSAQGITMAPWQGELEGTIEYDREDSKTKGSPTARFENTVAQEVFTLRNPAVHVYDPRLLTLSLEGSFGLFQERLTETDGEVGDFHHGTLLGYDLSAHILQNGPLSLRLFANRTDSHLPLGRPGASEIKTENRGAPWRPAGCPSRRP
jgi:hypothetical protein